MSAPARRIEVSVSSTIALLVDPAPLRPRPSPSRTRRRRCRRRPARSTRLAHRADHVEVGERRLHHHHVGALLDVEARPRAAPRGRWPGPSGSRAGRRTAAPSRRPRGTARRRPRRTWRRRRGSASSAKPAAVERARGSRPPGRPSCPRAPRCRRRPGRGRRAICASSSQGRVVPDLVALDDAAVAVGGVLAEADVGDDEQLAAGGADRARRPSGRRRRRRSPRCPSGSLPSGRPKRITPAMPRDSTSRASRAASSAERWKQPGQRRDLAAHARRPGRRTADRSAAPG